MMGYVALCHTCIATKEGSCFSNHHCLSCFAFMAMYTYMGKTHATPRLSQHAQGTTAEQQHCEASFQHAAQAVAVAAECEGLQGAPEHGVEPLATISSTKDKDTVPPGVCCSKGPCTI